ncbi:hypothetical protein B0O99DRAFT_165256 [Bisporella sp. PMI_857]|nr:hypothetical protein B0O99DRAFT_165256 [Bisporella sp. PMI_857]
MAPSSYISLVLSPTAKDALQSLACEINLVSPVALDPMPYPEMHMTLVFLGANLARQPPNKRTALSHLLSTFPSCQSPPQPSLQFTALELFPPTKRNLLIARYNIDGQNLDAVRELQKACYEQGLVSEEEHIKSQGSDFVAHVTLGKFRGMRADQSSAVEKAVLQVSAFLGETGRQALELPFEAACLCGAG